MMTMRPAEAILDPAKAVPERYNLCLQPWPARQTGGEFTQRTPPPFGSAAQSPSGTPPSPPPPPPAPLLPTFSSTFVLVPKLVVVSQSIDRPLRVPGRNMLLCSCAQTHFVGETIACAASLRQCRVRRFLGFPGQRKPARQAGKEGGGIAAIVCCLLVVVVALTPRRSRSPSPRDLRDRRSSRQCLRSRRDRRVAAPKKGEEEAQEKGGGDTDATATASAWHKNEPA